MIKYGCFINNTMQSAEFSTLQDMAEFIAVPIDELARAIEKNKSVYSDKKESKVFVYTKEVADPDIKMRLMATSTSGVLTLRFRSLNECVRTLKLERAGILEALEYGDEYGGYTFDLY